MQQNQILMLVGTFILGMLFYNMFKGICGCKSVEGMDHGPSTMNSSSQEAKLNYCNTQCENDPIRGACTMRCMEDNLNYCRAQCENDPIRGACTRMCIEDNTNN